MAGTLTFRVRIDHIYQRRFDLPDFATALSSSHWYLLTRRPAVRIVPGSVEIGDDIVTVDIVTRDNVNAPKRTHTVGADFRQFGRPRDFDIIADGAYFSMAVNDSVIHGDSWAFASLLTAAAPELACQEVLYVGQAFGNDGTSNAWVRTSNHKKLQRIYEDHVGTDYDIFVVPLSLERRLWSASDHIEDDEGGPDLNTYYEVFAEPNSGRIRKPSVDLVEHSLISHFVPHYNEKLTDWRADEPTDSMRHMRSAGFRLLNVHLSGWWGLARFHSRRVPNPRRSHFISQDLRPAPRPAVLRGISTEALSDWRLEAMIIREAGDYVSEKAELSGATMRVFGEEAPKIRRPSDIMPGIGGQEHPVPPHDTNAHAALRAEIKAQRVQGQQASAPTFHPGTSSYDPTTGTIQIGRGEDGTAGYWRLHNPETGQVESGLIFGDSGSGKSNVLNVISLEAILTNRFVVMPLDPSNRNDYPNLWARNEWTATGIRGTIERLTAVRRIIHFRQEKNIFSRPTIDIPAVLVTIDDADPVLRELGGAQLIGEVLAGGSAGCGLIIVAGIDTLRQHPDLLRALAPFRKLAFTPQGDAILAELHATYGNDRPRTESDRLSFVLHCGPATTTVGLIAGLLDREMSLTAAQAWCDAQFRAHGLHSFEWRPVTDESRSWSVLLVELPQFWFLRRHDDAWCLVSVISRTGKIDSTSDALRWANACISHRFECTLTRWQRGPAPQQDRVRAFYAELTSDLTSKDTTAAFIQMILDMQ